MSLVLLNEYKEILHIEGNDEDEFIGILAQEIEGIVKEHLNFEIEVTDYIQEYDGNNSDFLILDSYPIKSVSKIEVYEGLDSSNQEIWRELIKGVDYQRLIIGSSMIILEGYTFLEGYKNYRIKYQAGYEDCPSVIKNACKKLMKLAYDELKKSDSVGISSLSQGANFSRNVVFDKNEFSKILEQIQGYRKVNV